MEISEYKNIYKNESTHFFYVSTNSLVLSLIRKYSQKKDLKILDAGCGTGLLAKKLQNLGEVTGIDVSQEALRFAKKRGISVKKSSIEKLPFKKNYFDIVVSIDVLTHKSIKNDLVPLGEFYRVLKPGGILILRVSAHNWLHLIHDKHVHMNHRYGKSELFDKLVKIKFSVLKISFVHSVLFPLMVLKYLLEKISNPEGTRSAIDKVNPLINTFLTKTLLLENTLLVNFDIPFGIGLVAVARKLPNKIAPRIKTRKD